MTSARPSKIVCVGRNYVEHARELGNDVPKEPLIFLKPPSSVIRGGAPIRLPGQSKQVEFEGEIGIVVGSRLHHVSATAAVSAIAGIVALNDVGYKGPLSVEWEDSRIDREHGATEAAAFVKKLNFKPSAIAFDAQFDR